MLYTFKKNDIWVLQVLGLSWMEWVQIAYLENAQIPYWQNFRVSSSMGHHAIE